MQFWIIQFNICCFAAYLFCIYYKRHFCNSKALHSMSVGCNTGPFLMQYRRSHLNSTSIEFLLFEGWSQIAVVFFVRRSFDIVAIFSGGHWMFVSVNDCLVYLLNMVINLISPASCLFLSWSKFVVLCKNPSKFCHYEQCRNKFSQQNQVHWK